RAIRPGVWDSGTRATSAPADRSSTETELGCVTYAHLPSDDTTISLELGSSGIDAVTALVFVSTTATDPLNWCTTYRRFPSGESGRAPRGSGNCCDIGKSMEPTIVRVGASYTSTRPVSPGESRKYARWPSLAIATSVTSLEAETDVTCSVAVSSAHT